MRPIADSDWFMVAKVDTEEIMAEMKFHALIIGIFVALLIVFAAITAAFTYRQRQARLYQRLYATEREKQTSLKDLQRSESRLSQLAEQSGTIAWEVDSEGLYTYVSHVSEPVTGYRPKDMVGKMHFYDLHPEEGRKGFKKTAFEVFERKE